MGPRERAAREKLGRCFTPIPVGTSSGVRPRTAEKVFGVLAIVAGLAIIVLVIAGVDLWPVGAMVPALVALGWGVYHYIVVRPAPYGIRRPEDSPPHAEQPPPSPGTDEGVAG